MSEYVTVEVEFGDDPDSADLFINQTLTEEDLEHYDSPAAGDLGSPIAQMLFAAADGIQKLTISRDCLTITRQADYPWEALIAEVRVALRDWYL
ncbi:MAG: NifU N-terminal domain-containing protein [Chloroflexi bacterium]|nr:NifU N-terminal domain-containing protein [Chloroflexota bacterium]